MLRGKQNPCQTFFSTFLIGWGERMMSFFNNFALKNSILIIHLKYNIIMPYRDKVIYLHRPSKQSLLKKNQGKKIDARLKIPPEV